MNDTYEQQLRSSLFSGGNAAYLEELYEQYLEDPDSLSDGWKDFFHGFLAAMPVDASRGGDVPHGPIVAEFRRRANAPRMAAASAGGIDAALIEKQAAVMRLIEAFRARGHRRAKIDPLDLMPEADEPDLDLAYHGLSDADLDTEFSTVALTGPDRRKLRDILSMLRQTYSGSIGFEYMHVTNNDERRWLKDRIESERGRIDLSAEEKRLLLKQLTAAEGLEKYLHTRYVGQKRFSLEGGESLVPLLHDLIQQGGGAGLQEVVVGMAHRGRLNVLINVLGKAPSELFSEFEGVYDPKVTDRSGDVKYHLGFSSDIRTPGGNMHLVLAFNPSHLEIVDPVVEGSVRARQDRRGDTKGAKVMPVLIHGDAAFAGQGVVTETFQLSQARGFYTGGTIHIVVNNQVGFTISNPDDARSTPYATDVAKMIEAPILHVNGDDPEAVIYAARLALDYRMTFNKDIVIDLVCYRRHGHNEADEPSATQPVMYQVIKKHKTTRERYAAQLQDANALDEATARQLVDDYRAGLEEGKTVAPATLGMIGNEYTADWTRFEQNGLDRKTDTTIDAERVRSLGQAITTIPKDFKLHGRVQKIMDDRRKMLDGELPMDWGFA
ncbi:MAG TPA: thiamine pyrophosphate-dependent enzyme, partial [Gammaproteobacteria bacterium]